MAIANVEKHASRTDERNINCIFMLILHSDPKRAIPSSQVWKFNFFSLS